MNKAVVVGDGYLALQRARLHRERWAEDERRLSPAMPVAFRGLAKMTFARAMGGVEAPTYADLYSGAWTHPTCSGCLH